MFSFRSCQTRFEFLSQFRKVRNAFECFVTQVQTHLPKNQTRSAYEDKRDLYCRYTTLCNDGDLVTVYEYTYHKLHPISI